MPGIPRADGFVELAWRGPGDRNTDAAPGRGVASARIEWRPSGGSGWRGFLRVDNLFDRDYVGSVIVNEGNNRYFEPGAGRSVTVGLGWRATR